MRMWLLRTSKVELSKADARLAIRYAFSTATENLERSLEVYVKRARRFCHGFVNNLYAYNVFIQDFKLFPHGEVTVHVDLSKIVTTIRFINPLANRRTLRIIVRILPIGDEVKCGFFSPLVQSLAKSTYKTLVFVYDFWDPDLEEFLGTCHV
jgi:hypothetical protein